MKGICALCTDVGALQPNTTYTLRVSVGLGSDGQYPNFPGTIGLVNGTTDTGTPLATKVVSSGFSVTNYIDYTATFATGGSVSGDLTIVLQSTITNNTGRVGFDDVRLDASSPGIISQPVSEALYAGRTAQFTVGAAGLELNSYTAAYSTWVMGCLWDNTTGNPLEVLGGEAGIGMYYASPVWYFVALTITPSNSIVYVWSIAGGQAAAASVVTNLVQAFDASSFIGSDPLNSIAQTFDGAIAQVAVFNYAMTQAQVQKLYTGATFNPTITSQPVSESVYAGLNRSASLTVVASSALPLNYQWQSLVVTNGVTNGVNLSDGGNLSGATTPTLAMSNVAAANAGSYRVVVSNSLGVATSSAATVSLILPWSPNTRTYENAVIQANPVAYWPLSETGSVTNAIPLTANDYWGGYSGTYGSNGINGLPGPQPSGGFAIFPSNNYAVRFVPGTGNSFVTVPPLNLHTNTATIACWAYPYSEAEEQNGYCCLFYCRDSGTVAGFSYNDFSPDSSLAFSWGGSSLTYNWNSGITPPANQWSFVVLVVTPTTGTVYLYNTNTQTSATVTGLANSLQAFISPEFIGSDTYDPPARTFDGKMDQVAVFNYAMTPAQVQQLYNGASFLPTITSQPVSELIYAGGTAGLTVGALGFAPLYYQWQTNGVNLSDGSNLSGSRMATLTISNVSAANAGSYQVVVTNSMGAVTSTVATLTVVAPTGSGYESTILAANPVAYWRLNETGDPSSGTLPAYDYWGGHTGVYGTAVMDNLPGPRPANGFSAFESTNTAVEFTTNAPDCYITVPPLNLNTNTVTITCWIKPGASPQPSYAALVFCRDGTTSAGLNYNNTGLYLGYTWNGEPGTYEWNSGLTPPPNQWSFVALMVNPTSAILYLCNTNGEQSATNVYAHVEQDFGGSTLLGSDPFNTPARVFGGMMDEVAVFNDTLRPAQVAQWPGIVYPPIIVANPLAQPVNVGESFVFTVAVQGSQPLSYQWYRSTVPLAGATNATLSFARLSTNDSGSYTVQVTNAAGSATSAVAVLKVNLPPTAQDSVAGTVQNQPVTLAAASLLAGASDPNGYVLSVVGVTDSTNGAPVVLERDQIIYTPRSNFLGTDCFGYTIRDGHGGTASANVIVTVTSSNVLFPTLASAATPPPARFFRLPGSTPAGHLALSGGQWPRLDAPQGTLWLDIRSVTPRSQPHNWRCR